MAETPVQRAAAIIDALDDVAARLEDIRAELVEIRDRLSELVTTVAAGLGRGEPPAPEAG
jgi:hypothetical protein